MTLISYIYDLSKYTYDINTKILDILYRDNRACHLFKDGRIYSVLQSSHCFQTREEKTDKYAKHSYDSKEKCGT